MASRFTVAAAERRPTSPATRSLPSRFRVDEGATLARSLGIRDLHADEKPLLRVFEFEAACVHSHAFVPESRKLMVERKMVHRLAGCRRRQRRPKVGDVPTAVPELVDGDPLGLFP